MVVVAQSTGCFRSNDQEQVVHEWPGTAAFARWWGKRTVSPMSTPCSVDWEMAIRSDGGLANHWLALRHALATVVDVMSQTATHVWPSGG